jgi:hypothetical protein
MTDQGQDKNEFAGLNTNFAKDWAAVMRFSVLL